MNAAVIQSPTDCISNTLSTGTDITLCKETKALRESKCILVNETDIHTQAKQTLSHWKRLSVTKERGTGDTSDGQTTHTLRGEEKDGAEAGKKREKRERERSSQN